jgi:hypothetical protein
MLRKHQRNMRFVAFPTTECDEVFSGYQPGQMVERQKSNVSNTISVLVLRVLVCGYVFR